MSTTTLLVTVTAEVEANSAVENGAAPCPARAMGSHSRAVPTRIAAAKTSATTTGGRRRTSERRGVGLRVPDS